jgi:antitoxin YefM
MEAIYKLNAKEIDPNFMDTIKKLFRGKEITITITTADVDETDYLTRNPANKKHLLENIDAEPTISFTAGEFDQHVEDLLKRSK